MMTSLTSAITIVSVVCGFASAGAWLYASRVKVTREQMIKQRTKEAKKKGHLPDLSGASLDGWDMSSTFAAQSKWNARGAILAACAVALQSIGQIVGAG